MGKNLQHWIGNFLQDRKMKVYVRGSSSEWMEVTSGVPQGSVLGPLLFLIFVQDLPDWIKNSMMMFADDTKIRTAIENADDAESLEQDLNRLGEWSEKWLLKFKPTKCKVMHIGHDMPTKYTMKEGEKITELEQTAEEKDLGVIVTSDLKFHQQCVQAAKKAQSVLGMVKGTSK